MESNDHTLWFQCSKFINKTFYCDLSISVSSTIVITDTLALRMECSGELKCDTTGSQ